MIHEALAERVGQRSGRRAGSLYSPPTSALSIGPAARNLSYDPPAERPDLPENPRGWAQLANLENAMSKRIEVACSPRIKEIFVTAVRNYTDVAFPPGGADCALVARESLLDTLSAFDREYRQSNANRSGYNKRLRAMVKEGLRLHYQLAASDRGYDCDRELALLLEVAEGVPHSDADLEAACAADRAAGSATAAATRNTD